jgi:hypothetical protein
VSKLRVSGSMMPQPALCAHCLPRLVDQTSEGSGRSTPGVSAPSREARAARGRASLERSLAVRHAHN